MPSENLRPATPSFSGDGRHYDEIMDRIRHLKELFSLGEEIMPLLEELFLFLNDMTPLLGHVSDHTLVNQGIMPNMARVLGESIEQMTGSTFRIMGRVTSVQKRLDQWDTKEKVAKQPPEAFANELEQFRQDTDEIINALQFHDIVSQKLIHVKKVLSQAQSKLISLFSCINKLDVSEGTKEYLMQSLGVDPEEIDHILNSFIVDDGKLTADGEPSGDRNNPLHKPDMTQDEIDRLFG